MKGMKNSLTNMGEKLLNELGETSVKIGERAKSTCVLLFLYEPEMPAELIAEQVEE